MPKGRFRSVLQDDVGMITHLWCSAHNEYHMAAEFSKNKAVPSGYQTYCKKHHADLYAAIDPEVAKATRRAWYEENKDAARRRARLQRLKDKGITEEEFLDRLISQNGRCANLGCLVSKPGGSGDWHIDHDQSCCKGEKSCGRCIRGLLCAKCNIGLGYFNDDPISLQGAIAYLALYAEARSVRWPEQDGTITALEDLAAW